LEHYGEWEGGISFADAQVLIAGIAGREGWTQRPWDGCAR
jgi:hypothetical protein